MKYLFAPIFFLLSISTWAAQADSRDPHFHESGSGAFCARSAFAHGYRHGYEEGYHAGDMDINMGRRERSRPSGFRDSALHYSPEFGPKKSFVAGFQQGLEAGYRDGFFGRKFRAVEILRASAAALDEDLKSADPANSYFDAGVSAGYSQGLHSDQDQAYLAQPLDLVYAGCVRLQPKGQKDAAAQAIFCDGYQRGYRMGRADGLVLTPDANALASR